MLSLGFPRAFGILPVLFLATACGDAPAPVGSGRDAGGDFPAPVALDSGAASGIDAAPSPDAEPQEDAAAEDAAPRADAVAYPDAASPIDARSPDATPAAPDATVDAGVILTDGDGDGIADLHEGEGRVDTDGDGVPDSQDQDSDGDGIPDALEAGDLDLMTAPFDLDNDFVANFRDLDSDGDGIGDTFESTSDPDADGVPSYLDLDADGDTIRDDHEAALDADGDGIASYLDLDSDGDGILDAEEAGDQNLVSPPADTDLDGIADFLDGDSDNDTVSDAEEGRVDTDGDLLADSVDIDSDNDSILDLVEAGDASPATAPVDSDGDGAADLRDTDSDGDTILDLAERNVDTDGDGAPDRLDLDSDGDGVDDAIEAGDADPATPPRDTDGDGVRDALDQDSDGDALADSIEIGCPLGTSRILADSDGDGFVDPAEIAYASDPCSSASGIDDFYFVLPPGGPGSNAPLLFSDTAIDRADLAINMDNTGSMQGEIDNLRTTLSNTIIPGVRAVVPDAAFSVSSFDDYPIDPFGHQGSGDLPFRLGTRVTTDASRVQSAVNGLVTRSGLDFPESGLEALYQVATGLGTRWTGAGGSVPPFSPAQDRVPAIADGSIGGVGLRADALPIIVHVTDSISHTARDYTAVDPTIQAASTSAVRTALSSIGARVVTISSGLRPFNDDLCLGRIATFFGDIASGDADWFTLSGASQGSTVTIEAIAQGAASELDPMVAIANASGIIAQNDDISALDFDARVTAGLTGPGPYYVAIASTGDTTFSGTGGTTRGHYLVNVDVGGAVVMPTPTECRPDDSGARTGATPLVSGALAAAPADPDLCMAACDATLGAVSPLFEDFTFPYELSEDTKATIPPCAWSAFGPQRPQGCAPDQCCTGLLGAGVPPNAQGGCPLSFEIDGTGSGLDTALVTGIETLVRFSTFTVTTIVRPDPIELAATGLDTTCFVRGVIPTSATPPNTCAPQPVPADLLPPQAELDAFENVVPGTMLEFRVDAINSNRATQLPCVDAGADPQLFRAYIDVIADGVTVVDTRDVIIIVPPVVPGTAN